MFYITLVLSVLHHLENLLQVEQHLQHSSCTNTSRSKLDTQWPTLVQRLLWLLWLVLKLVQSSDTSQLTSHNLNASTTRESSYIIVSSLCLPDGSALGSAKAYVAFSHMNTLEWIKSRAEVATVRCLVCVILPSLYEYDRGSSWQKGYHFCRVNCNSQWIPSSFSNLHLVKAWRLYHVRASPKLVNKAMSLEQLPTFVQRW